MRRRHPRQLPMRFDSDVPAASLPAETAQEVVEALAELLLAADDDDERDDAREDHC